MYSDDVQVRVKQIEGEPWFAATDLSSVLKLSNCPAAVSTLKTEHLQKVKLQYATQARHLTFISRAGVAELLSRTRKADKETVKRLCQLTGITAEVIYREVDETKWLSFIQRCFPKFAAIRQFPIGSYFIDMYFPSHRLAIECDERGHSDRDAIHEYTRERFIKEQLNCEFIRFNPDEKDFDISKVIGEISSRLMT